MAKLNDLIDIMIDTTVTKKQICTFFNCNERQARAMIEKIAKDYPVIACSKSKGYRIASKESDIEALKISYLENQSRIKKLSLRNKPMQEFFNKFNKNY